MNSKTYAKYSWNQNDYINVMVYSFKNTDHTSVTLGISNIPYKVAGYPDIEGLTNSKNYPLNKPGSFPYCVSLNAIYVDKKYEGTRYTTDKHQQNYQYNTADPNATLAHELDIIWGFSIHSLRKLAKRINQKQQMTMMILTIAKILLATTE